MSRNDREELSPDAISSRSNRASESQPDDPAPRNREKQFLLVGIGSSAGGLEALQTFFDNVPADSGIAYVVVTHLQAQKHSDLAEILARNAKLPVLEAQDGKPVEPNHVYTIPPDSTLTAKDGVLRLAPRTDGRPYSPIDSFLVTAADAYGPWSAAVILSGSGHDGTRGALAVQDAGGFVIAQDPGTARFADMPESVIRAGYADEILDAQSIPRALADYANSLTAAPAEPAASDAGTQRIVKRVLRLLHEQTHRDFSEYKISSVIRRIDRRRRILRLPNLASYAQYVQEHREELETLAREILVGVTRFFRDADAYEALRNLGVLPLIASKPDGAVLRVWIPGVGTGEEAYSLAILIHECLAMSGKSLDVQIFGSDINEYAIETARRGEYPAAIDEYVSKDRLKRYFNREQANYRVKRDIRDWIVFAIQDVTQDPPFTRIDLISCRNLLIYLNPTLQRRLLPLFHYALNPDGCLFLGTSENIGEFVDLFEVRDSKHKVFCRKDVVRVPGQRLEILGHSAHPHASKSAPALSEETRMSEAIERALLDSWCPAGAVVDRNGDIVYIHGRTGRFLEPPAGRPRHNLCEMAREGLSAHLPGMLRRVEKSRTAAVHRALRVRTNGETISVDVRVEPLAAGRLTEGLLHVVFEESSQDPRLSEAPPEDGEDRETHLERELARTQSDLQATIEELQTSNEELRSINEEYQSANEELQSANEELQTSREEMQSLNEELSTVNDELRDKVEHLTDVQENMKLFLNSMEIPTVFLNAKCEIERFTPQVCDLINVIDSDIGRPIFHISTRLDGVDLLELCKGVLSTNRHVEQEIQTEDGKWHLIRILPYRRSQTELAGVVATFVNIDELKQKTADLAVSQANRLRSEGIVDAIPIPLAVIDREMNLISANPAFEEMIGIAPGDSAGKALFDLNARSFDHKSFVKKVKSLVDRAKPFDNFTLEARNDGSTRNIVVSGRRLDAGGVPSSNFLLMLNDEWPSGLRSE